MKFTSPACEGQDGLLHIQAKKKICVHMDCPQP